MAEEAGWCPPNAQELLEASIPDGSQWYEVRMPLKTLSYQVNRYYDALKEAKAFKKVFKAALFYCFKENGVTGRRTDLVRAEPSRHNGRGYSGKAQMAEVAVPEALFSAFLERIRCLAGAPT